MELCHINPAEQVRAELDDAIRSVLARRAKEDFSLNFTRNRKLSPETLIKMISFFGGNSLAKELRDFGSDVAVSSFVEAREKLAPDLFYEIMMRFNEGYTAAPRFLFNGKRLVAVDGVCINTACNPDSPSFMPNTGSKKGGYNQFKANVMVDLLSHIPVDLCLQPISRQDELGGALGMLEFNPMPVPTVIVGDRAYAAYPFIAELQNTPNVDFVLRVKNNGFKPLQGLEYKELDTDVEFTLTDKQTNEAKQLGHIYVNTGSKFGKQNSPKTYVSRFRQPLPYVMRFRVVRTPLNTEDGTTWETLVTSLPRDQFTAEDIIEIYRLRWAEELYFRHIKHDCGLCNMHSKREDYSIQQIYATFLTSSVIWKIINSVALTQKPGLTYEYSVNTKMATYLIKNFMKSPGADGGQLMKDLTRYVVPVRPGRSASRDGLKAKSFVPFCYRIA